MDLSRGKLYSPCNRIVIESYDRYLREEGRAAPAPSVRTPDLLAFFLLFKELESCVSYRLSYSIFPIERDRPPSFCSPADPQDHRPSLQSWKETKEQSESLSNAHSERKQFLSVFCINCFLFPLLFSSFLSAVLVSLQSSHLSPNPPQPIR